MNVQTYTIDQLAVLFQRSASTLRGYLDDLEGQHGFPPKLPCFDNLWSKPAVDRWIEGNGQPEAQPMGQHAAHVLHPWPQDPALTAKYGSR
jgi:hypothetical protein